MRLSDFASIIPVEKGWSGDKKFLAADFNGAEFLVRISPNDSYGRKKFIFESMQRLYALGIPMCRPVELGMCDAGTYTIESWLDGSDAETVIPALNPSEQYDMGLIAGKIQRIIHSLPASDSDWGNIYRIKVQNKIAAFLNCGITFNGSDLMLRFINDNLHLLDSRPKTLQHGDFHRGNLIISPDRDVFVIDFDRLDYGDPWEDIKAITWDVGLSPEFASGRIDGYFDGTIPDEFWRLLALYICVGTISSIPWAVPFGQDEIETMIGLADEVMSWYGDFADPVPGWYINRV